MAFGVVPNLAAIPTNVSPAFTLYVRVPVVEGPGEAGVAELPGASLGVAGALEAGVPAGGLLDGVDALARGVSCDADGESLTPAGTPPPVSLARTTAAKAIAISTTMTAWPDTWSALRDGIETARRP